MKTMDELLARLEARYRKKDKLSEFSQERPIFESLWSTLENKLKDAGFEIEDAINIGSTATIWKVKDVHLEQPRALKLTRPRLSKLKDVIAIIRAEGKSLASLSHENLLRVYHAGELDQIVNGESYSFPFFVMDYLEGVDDFDEFILNHRKELSGSDAIGFIHGILRGISYLHRSDIIHCDIKPGNLLIAPSKQKGTKPTALVADLGYAKKLMPLLVTSKTTDVTYTAIYAHPELRARMTKSDDSNANVSPIPRDSLRSAFDLFALGRSLQELLTKIRKVESKDVASAERRSLFSRYQWQYLEIIACRLLDGKVENRAEYEEVDVIPGLAYKVMGEIKYDGAEEALLDVEKLLNLFDLEGEVPEMNPEIPSYIQIPHCKVPLTVRVKEIVGHVFFRRLSQISQLGFVSLVYPGAMHTRQEHVLGTYATCAHYLRALWYDEANPLFRSVISKADIECCLLSALLHDIAQYPMAHDLADVDPRFSHENMTRELLERKPEGSEHSIGQLISGPNWNLDIENLLLILEIDDKSTFRHRILHSIISGPLDCDKLDYLRRDSTHLGAPFAASLDDARFIRNLTLVYRPTKEAAKDQRVPIVGQDLEVAEIGVTEKALIVAQALWRVRQDMFTQVYWQHTVRALKAMLGYAVRRMLVEIATDDKAEADFWHHFNSFVLMPSSTSQAMTDSADASNKANEMLTFDAPSAPGWRSSGLAPTDDAVLQIIWRYGDGSAKRVVEGIADRRIYKRVAVISAKQEPEHFEALYARYSALAERNDLVAMENDRKACEQRILGKLKEVVDTPKGARLGLTSEILDEISRAIPLAIVDVPVKSAAKRHKREVFWLLPEDSIGVHGRPTAHDQFRSESVMLGNKSFDYEAGKIRVFVHPRWADLVAGALESAAIVSCLGV
jgi:HD superfamily phosphohydrolase